MANKKYTYISTATTTQVLTGQGNLHSIIIGETAAGSITIYDETGTGDSNVIAVLKASIAEGEYNLGVRISEGIKIVTAGASKITVFWNKN